MTVNAPPETGERLPGNLNVSFDGIDGEALLVSLDDIAVRPGRPARRPNRRTCCWRWGCHGSAAGASIRSWAGTTAPD
jgi:hypothetical protein